MAKLAHEQMAASLFAAGDLTKDKVFQPRVDAAGVHERINLLMWIDRCWVAEHFADVSNG